MPPKLEITDEMREAAEAEIREKQKPVDYDTKEYPIEILIQKYQDGLDDDTNELFIPDYQREIAWDEERQSKFIESVLLGLPIPYIFVADVREEARLEIIDGTQRIRTLAEFLNDKLILSGLKKLEKLNGFIFTDLPLARQRRFKRTTIRMIQLTENADEEIRRDIFERINTGSVELNEMEKRRGIMRGPFLEIIDELSKNKKFLDLCSFTKVAIDRREPQEFVLRFFAFLNNYNNFNANKVNEFLDEYLKTANENNTCEHEKMQTEFLLMLDFVEQYFPKGFRQGKDYAKTTTRIKFESLSVGVALALREKRDLKPQTTNWVNSDEFKKLADGNGSSSRLRVIKRIEYVRSQLLGKL
ncbi:DUF262 domain-containing protein [Chlorogloeopsis fritschii PCC 9212]|uniref:GmrSD restriction endonucleases N-terminal domain-containing protein n=1 Tax=Chlorogloeopsis fritschii PCC 6912 TaxID=211165 RepID=A0A433N958_CHLFR|nr:DUF262 domain-containing protein [Chlorogloeopsis fritschii]RUR78298.1 hypothetical protein PCC6912_36400 [Chlorogloeopsis fritschii PCC 6912]